MSSYSYVAIDAHGSETRGSIEVADHAEALQRIKQMGLFPTKVFYSTTGKTKGKEKHSAPDMPRRSALAHWLPRRIRTSRLAVFTRQLATLTEAGLPLLRGLRILQEQEESRFFKSVIGDLCLSIEGGSSLAEAMAEHPKVFNAMYVHMIKAGEVGGALESALSHLAEFMERTLRIKGKIKGAMFYPCAVLVVAAGIVSLLMVFVIPRFRAVFESFMNGAPLPAFTRFVFSISQHLTHSFPLVLAAGGGMILLANLSLRTAWGRWAFDRLKLALPILGPLFRKVAISRFARTLGTLVSNGVPILQALTIVSETTGNGVVSRLVCRVHAGVKQGEPIAPVLRTSSVFPAMVTGMVDVGEQTGALPELLLKVADTYDEEVDRSAGALASLLEPIMIVILAFLVGSLVIAMFLPLIRIVSDGLPDTGPGRFAD